MKIFNELKKIVSYLKRKHKEIGYAGIHGMTMLRKNSGRRIILEDIRGMKLIDYVVMDEKDLAIQLLAVHFEFKGKKKSKYSHFLLLSDLILINVYDDHADFFTNGNIDFSYMDNRYQGHLKVMQCWKQDKNEILRARWTSPDDDVETSLQNIGLDQKVRQKVELKRGIRFHNPSF